jgi:hypothetical protein
MYTPKFSTKRVLGLVMATALGVSGVVAVAGNSEAATLSFTASPKTGPAYSGTAPTSSSVQVITVTGKGFMVGTTDKVGGVSFVLASATCAATYGTQTLIPTTVSAVSPTKLVVTTGTGGTAGLPLSSATATSTAYTMCIYDVTSSTAGAPNAANKLVGTAKYTVYPVATITSVNAATSGAVTGSSLGGDTITIVGTNFSKASVVRVDGVVAKTTYVDATDLTAVTPAHAAAATKTVTVTTESGIATSPATFTYLDTIKISPAYGDGTAGNVLSVTGTGFLTRSFVAGTPTTTVANKSVVVLNLGGAAAPPTGAYGTEKTTGGFYCTNVQVESDTTLNCQVPAIVTSVAGPYTVQIADGSAATNNAAITAVSRSATYTVSAF